jgi:hypothetical protein
MSAGGKHRRRLSPACQPGKQHQARNAHYRFRRQTPARRLHFIIHSGTRIALMSRHFSPRYRRWQPKIVALHISRPPRFDKPEKGESKAAIAWPICARRQHANKISIMFERIR